MQHEMREEWSEALEILETILDVDQANSSARKRKVREGGRENLYQWSDHKERGTISNFH